MGIKYFFSYFKGRFPNRIKTINNRPKSVEISIDNLLIDMNGIFHNCAQKVYEYGNFQSRKPLLVKKKTVSGLKLQLKFFEEVGKYIEMLYDMVEPQKRLILCVDGVAPLSKQSQQRQRRFKAALERKEDDFQKFDSNCITPGTKLMDQLCRYVDWFIRKKIRDDERWSNIDVIFSNEKVPSEGEHKLIQFIKRYGTTEESYMIQGMDADLIMLSLSTNKEHFYILREDHRSTRGEFFIIDVDNFRADLLGELMWDPEGGKPFDPNLAIYDFILMCFTVGNDFLPNIPTIGILEGGLEILLNVYKNIGYSYGHFVSFKKTEKEMEIDKKALEMFFRELAKFEETFLSEKMTKGFSGYEDPLLKKYATFDSTENKYNIDFKLYKRAYYKKKLDVTKDGIPDICHHYIKGLNWVLNYYTLGVPSWNWLYPYHYAPFFIDLAENTYSFSPVKWQKTEPISPFQQLLCVLPSKSFGLIPSPLNNLILEDTDISEFYPTEFQIDLDGKRNDWEGIAILPFVDLNRLNNYYYSKLKGVDDKDKRRNITGKSYLYKKTIPYLYKSFYGDLENCTVNTLFFEL